MPESPRYVCKISKPITPHSLVDELFMKYFSDLALREDTIYWDNILFVK